MTTSIPNHVTGIGARHGLIIPPDAPQKTAENHTLDPATAIQLSQAQVFMDNARHAWAKQSQAVARYGQQLVALQRFAASAATQLGMAAPPTTVAPHPAEVLAHPEVLEELKKQRERETRLSQDVGDAIDAAQRPSLDLLKMLGFLPKAGDVNEEADEDPDPLLIKQPATDTMALIWNSHSEFYEQIGLLIAALKENWLGKYQNAMKVYIEFYDRFSNALETIDVQGKGDKGDVQVYFFETHQLLHDLAEEYSAVEHLAKNSLGTFDTEAGANQFKDSFGLPGLKVVSHEGKFYVAVNTAPVTELKDSMNDKGNHLFTWDSAKYNAWVSFKDSNVEQVKHVSKVLGEKLSETTQQFDNIVKILSSTIDKITQADMSFVNGL